MDEKPPVPSLPNYIGTHHFIPGKQQGILNKMLGKMLVKRLPRLGRKGKVSSDKIKIKHQKKVIYY